MTNELLIQRLRGKCAAIDNAELRTRVAAIIDAAVENADEYVAESSHDDDDWEDVFYGTIETECDDAPRTVKDWFDTNS